ncbi:MAG: beta-lactamase family protein [Saprospiraceae bacterium]|nr:beta-lactamase family protein [Saprospiraceae bacterium]
MKNLILIIGIAFLASCSKEEIELNPLVLTNNPMITATDSTVHNYFMQYKDGIGSTGVSIALYKNGVTSFYGYGETKKDNGKVPDKNTLYEIGSITKTYTSIAILKMLKENNHTIETPIRLYLPADIPTLARNGVELNFKHLLTHTSGLNYMPDNFGSQYLSGNLGGAFAAYDRNKLYTFLINANIRTNPFSTWEYSNTAMGLLGTILELNYNKSYGEVIKEKVFVPLNLNETFTRIEQTNLTNWATGYSKGVEAAYWNSLGAIDGAGVIKSNASDVLKYALANLNNPTSELGDAISQSHQITFLPFTETEIYKINMRLGWFQYIDKDLPNESFIWHNGGTGGFNSDLYINKNKNAVLVLLFNSDAGTQGRLDFTKGLLKLISN